MRRVLQAQIAICAAIAAMVAIGGAAVLASASTADPYAVTAAHAGKRHRADKRHHRRHSHHRRHRHHRHHRHHNSKAKRANAARHSANRASFDCTNAELTPTSDDLAAIRNATICLVNRERAAHGIAPLSVNGKLNRAAQGHSEDMVAQDYFSHYGPSGDTPTSRLRAAGYIYSSNIGYEVGENIAWGTLSLSTPKAIVEAWMHSPGHRENILDPHYRETGMGVVAALPRSDGDGQSGAMYTQDFGVIITG